MGIEFLSALQVSSTTQIFDITATGDTSSQMEDWGLGFYLLHGVSDGFYCHNDFNRSSTGIVDIAKRLVREHTAQTGTITSSLTQKISLDISQSGPIQSSPKFEVSDLQETVQSIIQNYETLDYHLRIQIDEIKKTLQNSEELTIEHIFDKVQIILKITDKVDPTTAVTMELGGLQQADINLDQIARNIQNHCTGLFSRKDKQMIKSGDYPVVLDPDTTFSLIHESIGHGVEADQIVTGQSFLSGQLGYKVGSSGLTITDDPHLRGVGWSEYDDEGTKTKGTLLVEDGILVDYLQNLKTSKILGQPNTGNARTSTYLEKPEPRQSNIYVEPQDYSVEEMIESVDNGYYLGPTELATMSIYTGELLIETQYAQRIEQGELTEFTRPVVLTGNALSLLSTIEMIGKDLQKLPTQCLKGSSRLDIGGYCPPMKLSSAFLK